MSLSRLLKAAVGAAFLILGFAFLLASPMHTAPANVSPNPLFAATKFPAAAASASLFPLPAPAPVSLANAPSAATESSSASATAAVAPDAGFHAAQLNAAAVPMTPAEGEQFLFNSANRERLHKGLVALKWDESLAQAARKHAALMANAEDLSHQLPGEPVLSKRAAEAGAHFSHIGENIAVGPTAPEAHYGWMHSPGHRANILGESFNALGVGVVQVRDQVYAVEDFSNAVDSLSIAQQEKNVAEALTTLGFHVSDDHAEAERVCAGDAPSLTSSHRTRMSMQVLHLETSNLGSFKEQMGPRLHGSHYREAAVGACAPKPTDDGLARFRIAILLF